MSKMWWYSQNGQTSGPFPDVQLKDRLRSGELDREQAGSSYFDYIEGFYNKRRRHSALGYNSPVQFERARASA